MITEYWNGSAYAMDSWFVYNCNYIKAVTAQILLIIIPAIIVILSS